jgi:hypothetical protein
VQLPTAGPSTCVVVAGYDGDVIAVIVIIVIAATLQLRD